MFRVKQSDIDSGDSFLQRAIQAALVLALVVNCASAILILSEYYRLRARLDLASPISPDVLASLRSEFGIQSILSIAVSAILLLSTGAIWWLRRRYLSSQKSLQQIKMMAHDILASMDRGVVTTNWSGIITSINSAAIRLLGVDFECVGRPLGCVASDCGNLIHMYGDLIEGRAPVRDQDFSIERDNRRICVRTDGHLLTDNEGNALGCVIHLLDITDRTLMEERMRRMERFLSLATLASGLHHEIKNPLTALSIHVQLLEETLLNGQSLESAGELVGILKTEVYRLNGVLETFKSFANLQRLTIQPTDVLAVVNDVIRLIKPQAAEHKVEITLVAPSTQIPPVPLDPEKFEQALLNLVINGLEAMPEGGELIIRASAANGEVRVSVEDGGPGIPLDVQQNLFQPYFSTKATGTGIGLALSEKLISQHGGRIDYSTGPVGSIFHIIVPLQQTN